VVHRKITLTVVGRASACAARLYFGFELGDPTCGVRAASTSGSGPLVGGDAESKSLHQNLSWAKRLMNGIKNISPLLERLGKLCHCVLTFPLSLNFWVNLSEWVAGSEKLDKRIFGDIKHAG